MVTKGESPNHRNRNKKEVKFDIIDFSISDKDDVSSLYSNFSSLNSSRSKISLENYQGFQQDLFDSFLKDTYKSDTQKKTTIPGEVKNITEPFIDNFVIKFANSSLITGAEKTSIKKNKTNSNSTKLKTNNLNTEISLDNDVTQKLKKELKGSPKRIDNVVVYPSSERNNPPFEKTSSLMNLIEASGEEGSDENMKRENNRAKRKKKHESTFYKKG